MESWLDKIEKDKLITTIQTPEAWLSPDGEYYDAFDIGHEVSAQYILKAVYDIDIDLFQGTDTLEKVGWVRLTTSAMWIVRIRDNYWDRELTQAQINALYDWCLFHKIAFPYEESLN